MFKRSTNSGSNWIELIKFVFEEGGKPEYPEKNPRSKLVTPLNKRPAHHSKFEISALGAYSRIYEIIAIKG